jgi:hypothetical protein
VIGIIFCFSKRSDNRYISMPSPVYQNVVNLMLCLSVIGCPSKFMNVVMWEHCTFVNLIFGCGQAYCHYPLSLLILCKISFPVILSFSLKSLTKISMWHWGIDSVHFIVLHRNSHAIISFILYWGTNIQNNDITPATS